MLTAKNFSFPTRKTDRTWSRSITSLNSQVVKVSLTSYVSSRSCWVLTSLQLSFRYLRRNFCTVISFKINCRCDQIIWLFFHLSDPKKSSAAFHINDSFLEGYQRFSVISAHISDITGSTVYTGFEGAEKTARLNKTSETSLTSPLALNL